MRELEDALAVKPLPVARRALFGAERETKWQERVVEALIAGETPLAIFLNDYEERTGVRLAEAEISKLLRREFPGVQESGAWRCEGDGRLRRGAEVVSRRAALGQRAWSLPMRSFF